MLVKTRDPFPFILLIPAFTMLAVIVAWPLFETIRLSFTNASMRPETNYVGFENYVKIFDRDFDQVILRTIVWAFVSVSLKMIVGLIGAVLLNAAVPGRALFRVLVMPPWIVPVAIGVFIWGWLYNGQFGMFSGIGQQIGIFEKPFEFLAYKQSAFYATVVTDVWVGTPMVSLYLLASLQSISPELYEAAYSDGASRWYRFWRITLPLILPAMATMTILATIWTFNSFEIIWILTEGGPRGSTTTMIIDTYKTAISKFRYGEGAARAVMILLFLSAFTFVYVSFLVRLTRRSI